MNDEQEQLIQRLNERDLKAYEGIFNKYHIRLVQFASKFILDQQDAKDIDQMKVFYTAMYHLFIQPNNITDSGESPFYSTLSLWDTYRAAHPLYTLLCSERVGDFISSMLKQYESTGLSAVMGSVGRRNVLHDRKPCCSCDRGCIS